VPFSQRGQRTFHPEVIIYCILCGTGTSFVYQEYLAAFIFKTWEIAAKKIEMTLGIHKLVAYQSQILNQ